MNKLIKLVTLALSLQVVFAGAYYLVPYTEDIQLKEQITTLKLQNQDLTNALGQVKSIVQDYPIQSDQYRISATDINIRDFVTGAFLGVLVTLATNK